MIDTASVDQLGDRDVYDASGSRIGTTSQVYLDDATGLPEWVTVRTGLLGTKETFVPLRDAQLTTDGLRVPISKDVVKDAPAIEPDGRLSPAEERELYRYYGIERDTVGVDPGADGGRPRTVTESAHPVARTSGQGVEAPRSDGSPEPASAHGDQVAGPLDAPEAQRNVASSPEEKPLLRRYGN